VEGAKDLQFFGIIDNKKNWLKDLSIENGNKQKLMNFLLLLLFQD
jgi:hypothetical protein